MRVTVHGPLCSPLGLGAGLGGLSWQVTRTDAGCALVLAAERLGSADTVWITAVLGGVMRHAKLLSGLVHDNLTIGGIQICGRLSKRFRIVTSRSLVLLQAFLT